MSENQATATDDDFDAFSEEAQSDAIPAQAGPDDVLGDFDFNDMGEGEDDDLFAGADFDLEEQDSGESIEYRDAGSVYDNPLVVGLKDKMWVPIRLSDVTFKEKHTPRLSSEVCLAVTVDENGKKRVHVPYDRVEAALAAGATEVFRKQELPFFIAEANHVAPEFGRRRYPYEIEVPALTIKTKYFRKQHSGKTGYKNDSGYSLRKATGATEAGDKVNLQTMPGIAKRMDDQIVMARITINSKPATRPRLDPVTKQQITVLADTETAQPITVIAMERQKNEDGSEAKQEYMYNDKSGMVWEGNPKLLVPLGNNVFAIADGSDSSAALMEEYTKVTDYLDSKAPFLPVPDRKVQVEMIDEKLGQVEGEITLGTVGAIVQGKTSGDYVDVLLRTGKKVTAVWLGTHWMEVATDAGESGEMGEFAGVGNL